MRPPVANGRGCRLGVLRAPRGPQGRRPTRGPRLAAGQRRATHTAASHGGAGYGSRMRRSRSRAPLSAAACLQPEWKLKRGLQGWGWCPWRPVLPPTARGFSCKAEFGRGSSIQPGKRGLRGASVAIMCLAGPGLVHRVSMSIVELDQDQGDDGSLPSLKDPHSAQ